MELALRVEELELASGGGGGGVGGEDFTEGGAVGEGEFGEVEEEVNVAGEDFAGAQAEIVLIFPDGETADDGDDFDANVASTAGVDRDGHVGASICYGYGFCD